MTMSSKSKAYLVGGGIGSLAAARPGSVGVLDPNIPNQVRPDAELHHFRKLRRVRGSDERVVSGGQVKFREDIVDGLRRPRRLHQPVGRQEFRQALDSFIL